MNLKLIYPILFVLAFLTSCNSSKSVRLKDSSNSSNVNINSTVDLNKINDASIVHIDQKQRVITIRSQLPLVSGYYTTHSTITQKESSVIKIFDSSDESIITGDILKGAPKMNDYIAYVTEKKAEELEKYYSNAVID